MSTPSWRTIFVLITLFTAGCAFPPLHGAHAGRSAGKNLLEQGISHYEEGHYQIAARRLRYALEEGLDLADRVKAHKFLAFIACVSGQPISCREEFDIALDLDPKFGLDDAEAGHPIWGPIFKAVKSKK
jgi:Tfp pilus assembly protein PilF